MHLEELRDRYKNDVLFHKLVNALVAMLEWKHTEIKALDIESALILAEEIVLIKQLEKAAAN